MNLYTFMCLDDLEEGEEISSRKKSFIKRALAYIKIRRQANRVTRNIITRDHAGAPQRLVAAFFSMPRLTNHDANFLNNTDCTGREGISSLIKCTSSIRKLTYDVNASFLDEYVKISERSSHKALDHFCQAVMDIYGREYLRKPTVIDTEKLDRHHEEKHGFQICEEVLTVQIGSGLVVRAPLKHNMLDVIMIPFVANGVSYRSGCYIVDGLYPESTPLVKKIPEPSDDDHKRILYKQKQKSTRKDVERAFGVLKKK
nr:hypothetical protein [Tanacetum cinerariifolium]